MHLKIRIFYQGSWKFRVCVDMLDFNSSGVEAWIFWQHLGNSMPMAPCVGRHDVYHIMMPWKRGKFSPTSSQNTPHCSSARAMYVMYFVSSNCYLYSAPVTAVTNAISCYIGQRYNGTWLYIIGQMSHIFYEKVFQSPVSRQLQWNYDMFHSVIFSVRQ